MEHLARRGRFEILEEEVARLNKENTELKERLDSIEAKLNRENTELAVRLDSITEHAKLTVRLDSIEERLNRHTHSFELTYIGPKWWNLFRSDITYVTAFEPMKGYRVRTFQTKPPS